MGSFATKNFSKGELIIKEGDSGEEAYVINKGHVEVRKTAPNNEEVLLARLGPGQIFGEMCLFDNSPRSASVYAISALEVNVIDKDQFLHYMKDTPMQIKVIVELLLKRLRQTSYLVSILKLEISEPEKRDKLIEENIKDLDFPT